jgi:integrase
MPRSRKGSTVILKDGSLWARVRYIDEQGRRKERRKRASNPTDANKKLKAMLRELDDHGARALDTSMTFARWIDHYETTYLIAPEYRDDSKVAGLRSWRKYKSVVKVLRAHFGNKRLQSISYSQVEQFRNYRLQQKTKRTTPRAIATVNRELSLLRRVLNVAKRDGWITRNPFDAGEPLIRAADEKNRERILTYNEEDRLLAVCTGRREHLHAILVCALDTGMRRGEIITLTWQDVNLEERTIALQALNTKTIKRRVVPMSNRLHAELTWLWDLSTQRPERRVFGIANNFKRSFTGACKDASVLDFRFHDCRHTAATRWIQAGMSLQEVGRLLGHSQAQTTYRYVNADESTVRRAAEILNEIHRQRIEASEASPN